MRRRSRRAERNLWILADDTYDEFLYDGATHTSPASLQRIQHRTLTINTCSKTYAMTGWRIGWVTGPAEIMPRVRAIKEATTGATSTLAQVAALAALTGPQEIVAEMRREFATRRRLTLDALDGMNLRYGMPYGGQFVLVDISSLQMPSLEVARLAFEREHILLGAGAVFGEQWDQFIRIAWLLPRRELAEGMERMRRVVQSL
jgi:aspartate/methionine/tyrosine aminotransferase